MPRPISIPKLTRHTASGKAVVRLNGRDHYVGIFGTPEAETAYNRLIAEWLAKDRRPLHLANTDTHAVTHLCRALGRVARLSGRRAPRTLTRATVEVTVSSAEEASLAIANGAERLLLLTAPEVGG